MSSATPTATETGTPTVTVAATETETGTPTSTVIPTATGTATETATITTTATMTATAIGPVPNDDFDSATLISHFPFTATQDTTKATTAWDEPDMEAGAEVNSNTVWYRFVAPSNTAVRANSFSSDYDTVLAAFRGTRGSLVLLASNDDAEGDVQSQIVFEVQAGTTYYLEVAQYGEPAGGRLSLTVEIGSFALPTATLTYAWPSSTPYPTSTPTVAVPPPGNDDFDSAMVIEAFPFDASLDTRGATLAGDDPEMGDDTGRNSNTVWYRFTAQASGSVRLSTLGSNYDTVLAVFTGSRGLLATVAANDDATYSTVQSELVFNVQAGITYFVEVAQYGLSGGGTLRLRAEFSPNLLSGTPSGTPAATPGVLAASPTQVSGAPTSGGPVARDGRFFPQTGYRINLDPFWDYFNKRGGVRTFGYPVSREFPLLGFTVQFFQRAILQLMPGGGVATMNLLDEGLMPYDRINGSTFPPPEQDLIDSAPSPLDPEYGEKAIAFLRLHVPDNWEGMEVRFFETFTTTVRYEDAFPTGEGEPALVPLLNLEIWGLPTSRPARDPGNSRFVYQRFQRGIMHYDDSTGATQGLLLADYLKGIITGRDIPPDLAAQARNSRFYRQYNPQRAGGLVRPMELPATNLRGAFDTAGP